MYVYIHICLYVILCGGSHNSTSFCHTGDIYIYIYIYIVERERRSRSRRCASAILSVDEIFSGSFCESLSVTTPSCSFKLSWSSSVSESSQSALQHRP